MNNNDPIDIHFSGINTPDFFNTLSTKLGGIIPGGNIVRISPGTGEGMIYREIINVINDDIVFISWDIRLRRSIHFYKKPVDSTPETRKFIISYMMNSEDVFMKSSSVKDKIKLRGLRNILFMSDDANMDFVLPAGEALKVINISVSLAWLKKELSGANHAFLDFLDQLGQSKDHPVVFMERTPPGEFKLLSELNPSSLSGDCGALYLKAKVFSLVADLFTRIFQHNGHEILESRMLHHDKMLEVENLLKDHLEKTLPDIGTIAKKVTLSLSTLKRHFKLMFGRSIYDYYLELKMEHARKLLTEKPLSVNEVACMLDYEKVSSFIDTFKKHHGYSPGMLRRKSA